MKEIRAEDNNYDLGKMKSKFYDKHSGIHTLQENLIAKIEKLAIEEEKFRGLKKRVEEWGGENFIASSVSKIKTLKLEAESKDEKIKELTQKLSNYDETKATDLLNALTNEDGDEKQKNVYLKEISEKNNEILELKEKLTQTLESLRNSQATNPFEKAGGSDDEDNKERAARTSIEHKNSKVEGRTSTLKSTGRKTLSMTLDEEYYNELEEELEKQKEKNKSLQQDLDQAVAKLGESKIKYRKFLVEKEKEIEKLRKGEIDTASVHSDDDNTSMSSKVSLPPNYEQMMNGNMFGLVSDQCTLDYLRNIFSKYLVYMAKKKKKKAETCENILLNILSVPEEQIIQINQARKKYSFWDWFKNFKKTGKLTEDHKNDLDMNLNFTMTEVHESMMSPSMYTGSIIHGDDHLNSEILQSQDKSKKKGKAAKKVKKEIEVKLKDDKNDRN
ncbi:unnamed protein product [Moneuplotes crassus]|uniref:Hypersensitivity response secretion-like HrpJ domain-containing protein n=2 Tax=Euplotes crassus TaxID=5936 RepID=A0AAD1U9G3_EUPCR|nr:unnamed protein product [Moneuplotes crassus]